jgi:hypothetical protein
MATLSQTSAGYIDPSRIYTVQGFYRDSGISKSRAREARLMGHPAPFKSIGRRKYIVGHDGVAWMLKLTELMGPTQ